MALALLLLLNIVFSEASPQGSSSTIEETSKNYDEISDQELGDPWETPLQELVRVTPKCSNKIQYFDKTAWKAEVDWQKCINSINPHIPALEKRDVENEQRNATELPDVDKKVYVTICVNTTAFKPCWTEIVAALNECEPGSGDVAGTIYFALYDDVCLDGGKAFYENQKKAEAQGGLCDRDYRTNECRSNRLLQKHAGSFDVCYRFKSNVACDVSSIHVNCSNEIDKNSHSDIFKRVGATLGCTQEDETSSGATIIGRYLFPFSFVFSLTIYLH